MHLLPSLPHPPYIACVVAELKQQAVTLFEAGKLTDRSVAELCGELRAVEKTRLEGELMKFTENAFSLRYALHCLRKGVLDHTTTAADAASVGAGRRKVRSIKRKNKVKAEEKEGEEGGIGGEKETPGREGGSGESSDSQRMKEEKDGAEGNTAEREMLRGDSNEGAAAQPSGEPSASAGGAAGEPGVTTKKDDRASGSIDEGREAGMGDDREKGGGEPSGKAVGERTPESKKDNKAPQDGERKKRETSGKSPIPPSGRPPAAPRAPVYNRVELLRVESLAGLPPTTLQRLMQRDYDLIVSLIPLPRPRLAFIGSSAPFNQSAAPPNPGRKLNFSVLPAQGSAGGTLGRSGSTLGSSKVPVHFGPPSSLFVSPWSKLFLYTRTAAGPVTFVLMRGLRFRTLPPPLSTCAKALVWSWDGQGFGGVGGSFEGSVIEGGVLLHVVNNLLRKGALMVQPLCRAGGWAGGQLARGQRSPASMGCLDKTGQPDFVSYGLPLGVDSHGREDEYRPSLGSLSAAGAGSGADEILEGPDGKVVGDCKEGGEPTVNPSPSGVTEMKVERVWCERSADEAAIMASEATGMDMVGFVRVMRVYMGGLSDNDAGRGRRGGEGGRVRRKQCWVPHSVELGLPLFDTQLCSQVRTGRGSGGWQGGMGGFLSVEAP